MYKKITNIGMGIKPGYQILKNIIKKQRKHPQFIANKIYYINKYYYF